MRSWCWMSTPALVVVVRGSWAARFLNVSYRGGAVGHLLFEADRAVKLPGIYRLLGIGQLTLSSRGANTPSLDLNWRSDCPPMRNTAIENRPG